MSSNAPKYEPRSAAQREADAKQNAAKYARQRRVNSAMTAKHLKAKTAFDTFFSYDIDDAFNIEDGSWNDEKDPWLRIPVTILEFLQGYTKAAIDKPDASLTKESLRALAATILRVAREEVAGAGRDNSRLDSAFQESVMEYVENLAAIYSLPDAPTKTSEDEAGEEED